MNIKDAIKDGKVVLSDEYASHVTKTQHFFFDAPKEVLGDRYPDAIAADISVELPGGHCSAEDAIVLISPVKETEDGPLSFDWNDAYDIDQTLELSDVAKLIAIWRNTRRLVIPLDNGFKLVAEQGTDPDYDRELYVGIERTDGGYQQLAVIRNAYVWARGDKVTWKEDEAEVLVYGDENKDDYTENISIKIRPNDDGEGTGE